MVIIYLYHIIHRLPVISHANLNIHLKEKRYQNGDIFRFANLFHLYSFSVANFLSAVKTVKIETSLDLSCNPSHINMLADEAILSEVMSLEQKLKIQSSEQINETLTKKEFQTVGEMFLYLIKCPTPIKPWIAFYKDLFQTQSSDKIILALNRVIKGPTTHQTNISLNPFFAKKESCQLR